MAISKKIRFEVFKRDSFTCQYCGKKAPDVILEVDHIHPKSKKGLDNMLNLVTSCFDCNRGKSDRKLSDNSVIEKQKAELLKLSEKKEQLDMLLKWRSSLLQIEEKELNVCVKSFEKDTPGSELNLEAKKELRQMIKKYGFQHVLEAIDACKRYIEYDKEKVTSESFNKAFNKISGICYVKSLPDDKQKEYREIWLIKTKMKEKFYSYNEKWMNIYASNFLKAGHSVKELAEISNRCTRYQDWVEEIKANM